MKQVLAIANRYKDFVIYLLAAAALVLSGWQVWQDINVTPDQSYIQQQTDQATGKTARINTNVIDAVRNLDQIPGQPDLNNLGKSDPFSP